jgi:5-methylcytosine-specific restriction endonuclease McrBC regulatory subunit McrC
MKWHPSALGKLMTVPKLKSEILSETAKSEIRKIAKEQFFGYSSTITTKPMMKGKDWEEESIALVNDVRGTLYVKNTERFENEFLTGEPDIIEDDMIIDIKTSWSLETFPATPDEGVNKDYMWQLFAYCWLLGKWQAELIYCMIDTDDVLLGDWENRSIHKVSHIDPAKRITVLRYAMLDEYIDQMREKLTACNEYYSQYINQLNNK